MAEADRIGARDTVLLARQRKRGVMASHETEIPIYRAPAYAWAACQAAVKAGGWKVSEDANWRLVCAESWSPQRLVTSNPAKIEIALYSAPQGCLVKVRASIFGVGPIASNHASGQVGRFVGLLTSVLDSWTAQSAPPIVRAPAAVAIPQNNRPVAVAKPADFREVLAQNELVKLTGNWTTPVLIRQYDPGDRGLKRADTESNLLAAHGYRVAAQSDIDGHVNLGRLALTGGLGLLFGGTRSKGRVTITFEKSSAR
jgi:hypothetical protein